MSNGTRRLARARLRETGVTQAELRKYLGRKHARLAENVRAFNWLAMWSQIGAWYARTCAEAESLVYGAALE